MRTAHLGMAGLLGFGVYAPIEVVEPFRPLLQGFAVPLATATGLLLWKQAAIARALRRLSSGVARPRKPAGPG